MIEDLVAEQMDSDAEERRTTAGVLHEVTRDHVNQALFVVAAVLVGVGYGVLLPFSFTQRVSWRNWDYLDARYGAFSVAFGLATGWVVVAQTYAMRRVIKQRGAALGGAGAALGLLPSFLCCTPIVPTLLSFAGLSGASLAHASGRTQYFFTTEQNLILAVSLGLVVIAATWATRRVIHAACLEETGCAAQDIVARDRGLPDSRRSQLARARSEETARTSHG